MPKLIITEDGSHTLYSDIHNAAYHSHYGAIEESITVFISAGLDYTFKQKPDTIKIFEMGFGTGLNAFLSFLKAKQSQRSIVYHGIELHPISRSESKTLNYPEMLNHSELFDKLHTADWYREIELEPELKFKKIQEDILDYKFTEKYDLIYFDAFAPSCQSVLWEEELHQNIFDTLNPGGCLVTYCAKGTFKRMLKSIGYKLYSLPGPGRKKEITRAIKALD